MMRIKKSVEAITYSNVAREKSVLRRCGLLNETTFDKVVYARNKGNINSARVRESILSNSGRTLSQERPWFQLTCGQWRYKPGEYPNATWVFQKKQHW
jgi:hypothetical protein